MFRTSLLAKSVVIGLAIVLAAGSASYAQGQQGGRRGFQFSGRGFGGLSKTALLRSEQVRKELNVTEDQLAKIKEIGEESRQSGRELFSGLRDLPQEERRKKFEELRDKITKAAKEVGEKITGVLNETQNKRLDQILLQQRGTSALTDKDTAAKLGITKEQQQKIKDLVEAQREMQQELFSGLRDLSREERREKFAELGKKREELRTETDKAVQEVLTAAQKSQLEQMKGKKFELDRRALFGGFGQRNRRSQDGGGKKKRRPKNDDT